MQLAISPLQTAWRGVVHHNPTQVCVWHPRTHYMMHKTYSRPMLILARAVMDPEARSDQHNADGHHNGHRHNGTSHNNNDNNNNGVPDVPSANSNQEEVERWLQELGMSEVGRVCFLGCLEMCAPHQIHTPPSPHATNQETLGWARNAIPALFEITVPQSTADGPPEPITNQQQRNAGRFRAAMAAAVDDAADTILDNTSGVHGRYDGCTNLHCSVEPACHHRGCHLITTSPPCTAIQIHHGHPQRLVIMATTATACE